MMITAFIFDLDGVIVDTARYHYLAWKSIAHDLGFEFTLEQNERLKGVSRMRSLDILLSIGGISPDEQTRTQLAETKNNLYLSYIRKMTPDEILPGARNFLVASRAAGLKTALGSASKNCSVILERVGIGNLFDAVIDGNKVSKAKPDPEVFLLAAEELGIDPSCCVVFEDAIAGVEAAHRGRMKCVGVGDPQTLKNAERVISGFNNLNVTELLRILS